MHEIGIPKWMHSSLTLDQINDPVPLRWDVIYSENQWKILEINTGFCLGGLNGYLINSLRNDFYSQFISRNMIPALQNAFYFLINNILHVNEKKVVILVIEAEEGYEKYGFYLNNFVLNMNKNSKLLFIAGKISDFEINQRSVFFKGYTVKHFIPMFTLYELSDTQQRYQSFLNAVIESRITSLLGYREIIFSNKTFIPLFLNYYSCITTE